MTSALENIKVKADDSESMIRLLKKQISVLESLVGKQHVVAMSSACGDRRRELTQLQTENDQLRKEIDAAVQQLSKEEANNGKKQFHESAPPAPSAASAANSAPKQQPPSPPAAAPKQETKPAEQQQDGGGKGKDKKKDKKAKKEAGGGGGEVKEIAPQQQQSTAAASDGKSVPSADDNVSKLDLRVGRILTAKKHPDADSLYVEDVDVGEAKNRTMLFFCFCSVVQQAVMSLMQMVARVISGLVKYVSAEDMSNRMVVMLCNLKPQKMRGILSEAMVMCASTPDKVEPLSPPEGAVPGDPVHIDGLPRTPEPVLNPKKKTFENVAPHLKTNDHCLATYDGRLWVVNGKGNIKAASLANVQIK